MRGVGAGFTGSGSSLPSLSELQLDNSNGEIARPASSLRLFLSMSHIGILRFDNHHLALSKVLSRSATLFHAGLRVAPLRERMPFDKPCDEPHCAARQSAHHGHMLTRRKFVE